MADPPETHARQPVRKATITLADGRELMYFGAVPERPADYPDRRHLDPVHIQSQARLDQLLGEWVIMASHRQDRPSRSVGSGQVLWPQAHDHLLASVGR